MSKPDRYKKRLKNILWVQWQIVRRHEDYINFCDKQVFNERGILMADITTSPVLETVDSGDTQNEIIQPTSKAESIKKRFFLNEIYHYSKDISKDDCLDVCGWRRQIFPIWPASKNFNAKNLPQYGEFIYLGINIAPDVMLKNIKDEVLSHVELMRHTRKASREHHVGAIKEKISKRKSQAKTQIKELKEAGEGLTIDPIIEKLQEEMLDIEQGPSQTSPGKDQRLDYYKELFRVWDLHIKGKTDKEVIQEIWPGEYKKEWKEPDFNKDERFFELQKKYRSEGVEDWEERAFDEAYGDRDENDENMELGSGLVKLFVRVGDKIDRMKGLFSMFPKT